jgi:FtsX extracellular domain
MPTDELRSELTTLADEIDPFAGDVQAVRRHVRSRRTAVSCVAAAVVAALGVATVAVTRNRDSGKIHVAAVPSKEVSPDLINHIDAIVVPASAVVKAALDSSPFVSQYARIPAADRSDGLSLLSTAEPVKSALCRLQTSDGYAVDAATPGPTFNDGLTRALGGAAHVTVTDQYSTDAEVFMQVGIAREYSLAIQGELASDPDVQAFRYVTTGDAYEIFKQDFAAQPALIESTKPSDLPESFRITVKPGRSVTTVVERYKHRDGVGTIITPSLAELFLPGSAVKDPRKHVPPCAKS